MYKTTITLTVLSEDEIPQDAEIIDIMYEATEGMYVAAESVREVQKITDEQMKQELYNAGSDPSFFDL